MQHWHEKEQLKAQIRKAFSGICLGNGIGLYEAQGLDDYATEEECAAYRVLDEKDDWQTLRDEDLNQCNSSLSFFDAEGMRFHLPAFLIASLEETYKFDMAIPLTHYNSEKFALLNEEQTAAVIAYLHFIQHDVDYQFDRENIQEALIEFGVE